MDFDEVPDDSIFRLPAEKFRHIISIFVKCAPSRAKQRMLLKAGRGISESLSTLFWLSDYERQQIVFGVTDLITTVMCAAPGPATPRLPPIAYNLQALRDCSRMWQKNSIVEAVTDPRTLTTTLSAIREGELYPYISHTLLCTTPPMVSVPPLPHATCRSTSYFNLTNGEQSSFALWADSEKLTLPCRALDCLRTLLKNGWSGETHLYHWGDNQVSVHIGEMWMTTQATAYLNKH